MVFLHFLLKFKPFDEFFPFQNVIANLSVCVATVCVCVHPLNKVIIKTSLKLSLALFFSAFYKMWYRMGRFEVCHRFSLKFKLFKM